MSEFQLPVSGTAKVWWRLDDSLNVDLQSSAFEQQDLGVEVTEFRLFTPEIFADIFELYYSSEFYSRFAGGSIAQLSIGDMIQAGLLYDSPYLGLLLNFEALKQLERLDPVPFIKMSSDLVIVDIWNVNFNRITFTRDNYDKKR